jgi:hypothetical protein
MRRTATLFVVVGLTAAAGLAQSEASRLNPPLVRSVTPSPFDSRLVQLAKRAIAARMAPGTRLVIDETTIGRGRVSQSTAAGTVDFGSLALPAPTSDAPQPPPDRAAMERAQKVEQLRREQALMAREADEGAYGEVEEDAVESRLSRIPQEIDSAQNPPAPPPPPV